MFRLQSRVPSSGYLQVTLHIYSYNIRMPNLVLESYGTIF